MAFDFPVIDWAGQPEVRWPGSLRPQVMPPVQKKETLARPVSSGMTLELRQTDMSARVREMRASKPAVTRPLRKSRWVSVCRGAKRASEAN